MLKLSAKVEILGEQKWTINNIVSCKITRSLSDPADYCSVVLPANAKWKDYNHCPVKRGDKIYVWLGYDDDLDFAFKGYVRSVSESAPIILDCEDEFFNYHRTQDILHCFNLRARPAVFLQSLGYKGPCKDFSSITDVTDFENGNVDDFRNSVYSAARYLNSCGIYCKFVLEDEEPILYFFTPEDYKFSGWEFVLTDNNIIRKSLNYTDPADAKCYVHIGSLPCWSYVGSSPVFNEIELGDRVPGAKVIIAKPSGWTKEMVESTAHYLYDFYTKGGLSGSILSFGCPDLSIADSVAVKINGNRMGRYLIRSLVHSYSREGLRSLIRLGVKFND